MNKSQKAVRFDKILNSKLILIFLSLSMLYSDLSCSGCSKSGIREASNRRKSDSKASFYSKGHKGEKTVVKMMKKDGVYQIPIEINGVSMYFIFDTGASMISISVTEANFLYKQGKLEESDIIGKTNFIDANGDISEGTLIMLKTVKIENKTIYNIKASVVHNLVAPILFGQSALERFGKISIDYKNEEITFE